MFSLAVRIGRGRGHTCVAVKVPTVPVFVGLAGFDLRHFRFTERPSVAVIQHPRTGIDREIWRGGGISRVYCLGIIRRWRFGRTLGQRLGAAFGWYFGARLICRATLCSRCVLVLLRRVRTSSDNRFICPETVIFLRSSPAEPRPAAIGFWLDFQYIAPVETAAVFRGSPSGGDVYFAPRLPSVSAASPVIHAPAILSSRNGIIGYFPVYFITACRERQQSATGGFCSVGKKKQAVETSCRFMI